MSWRSLGQTLVPVLAVVAFATTGCATSIAAKYPHLDRRSVCVVPPEIGPDATEWIYDENNHAISNFHPEIIDRVAMTASTVFEYDPEADPKSVKKLPAPHDELTCRERFSILPSLEPETSPLPEASLGLYVHKSPANSLRVPNAVAKQLASCPSDIAARLRAISYRVNFNVYVTDDGQAVAAYVEQSTLGDRDAEACMVEALRTTSWPVAAAASATPPLKAFFAQPAPAVPPVEAPPESGVRLRPLELPQGTPGGVRFPIYVLTFPLRVIAGAGVFMTITLSPSKLAPAWSSEMNPITGKNYTNPKEYEEVQRLSPQEIRQRRRAYIKATQPQAPPPPTPAPAPALTPEQQREQEKKAQRCAKIAKEIDELITTKREETSGPRPSGYQGLALRWSEYAENRGKWGPRPDGSPSNNMTNHLAEYEKHQGRLKKKLDDWTEKGCDEKDLPRDARQYAAQAPELGPGKPLKPAPTPTYSPAVVPASSPAKDKKRVK